MMDNAFFQVICGLFVVRTWDENFGDRKNNFGGSCLEGLRIIFSDTQVIHEKCQQSNIANPVNPMLSQYMPELVIKYAIEKLV